MGRPEAPLAGTDGAVEAFAAGLRQLRIDAGAPPYRRMARTTHFSAATLARAASGRALPSLDVTLAYVSACGGDAIEWRTRWQDAQHPLPFAETIAITPRTGPARPMRLIAAAGWLVALALVAANVVQAKDNHHQTPGTAAPARHPATASRAAPAAAPAQDGTDPVASGCNDARSLASAPVSLAQAAHVDGRLVPTGTLIGTVTLRYSDHCAGAWARFDPAGNVYTNAGTASITITLTRPADGTSTSFHLSRIEEVYGDLLLTSDGCVIAAAIVSTPEGTSIGSANTGCLRG